jgi:diguanylate cyclase (GGDEF)-like protein/PAS domain S-box-containing protein
MDDKKIGSQLHGDSPDNLCWLVFKTTISGFLLTSTDGSILAANPAACAMFQRTEEDICEIGRNGLADLSDARWTEAFEERARTGKFSGELRFVRKDATRFLAEVSSVIFTDMHGQVRTSISLHDISTRKQEEQVLADSEAKYRMLFETASDGIFLQDKTGVFFDCNENGAKLLGLSKSKIVGMTPAEISPLRQPDGRLSSEIGKQKFLAALNGQIQRFEYQALRADGVPFEAELTMSPVDFSGIPCIQTVVRDISERKIKEAKMAKALSLLNATLESTTDAILVVDLNNVWILHNQQFIDLWQITNELNASKDDHAALAFVLNQLEDADGFLNKVQELYSTPTARSFDTIKFKDGRIIERFSLPQFIEGKVVGRVWSFRDVTARKEMEEQVYQLAFYDALTKLPNRRLLNDRLNVTMVSSKRTGLYGALMFLDLDNFKPLNDTYGQTVGDLLLIQVAERLKTAVRAVDTLARFGGDEFVVILNELEADKAKSTNQALQVADKIRRNLSEPYQLAVKQEGKAEALVEHRCTISIGVSLFINHEGSVDDIIKRADSAMYLAKYSGRNSIRFYSQD